MATEAKADSLVDALARVEGKAEIVDGEIVLMPPAGDFHGRSGSAILLSLYRHERQARTGRAYGDNVGFLVDLKHRKSFSPDVAFYEGPRAGGDFLKGAPIFAAEVRSKGDYGPAAEKAMALKRADYFAAGTQVVWDVDVLREGSIKVYRATAPDSPTVYTRGQLAEAEPALPGWTFPVDDLFD